MKEKLEEFDIIKYVVTQLGMSWNEAKIYIKKYRIYALLNYWRYYDSKNLTKEDLNKKIEKYKRSKIKKGNKNKKNETHYIL